MSNDFRGRHFPAEFILLCVRWYLKFNVSYRHLAEMMEERGFVVHHTTIYRWIQTYAPRLEKLIRWYQGYTTSSWRLDETYINVSGEWLYLFRAIDSRGRTIDFYLSQRRNAAAARRFVAKAVRSRREWGPAVINTDRNPAYGEAIRNLKAAKMLDEAVDHRQVKYLNNRLEADHGAIKRRIRSMLGFKSAKTAYATLKGIEAMRMIRKWQCTLLKPGVAGETHFFNKLFGIYA
jgi:transposase, IS6 family